MELNLFFDESGKGKNKPNLMGALAIPEKIYRLPAFYDLEQVIVQNRVHWKEYKGDVNTRKIITKIIKTLCDYENVVKMNIFNYDYALMKHRSSSYTDIQPSITDSTIYMKFPERIVYGLLRDYGHLSFINSKFIIEEATEYKREHVRLQEKLPEMLNIQAMYRAQNFKVLKSYYAPKGEEVGLEATDIILGIVRTILTNPPSDTKAKREKSRLIVNLLKDERFYSILTDLGYYEWLSSHELTPIPFSKYLEIFVMDNHELYFS